MLKKKLMFALFAECSMIIREDGGDMKLQDPKKKQKNKIY